jgi:hypothetical protein
VDGIRVWKASGTGGERVDLWAQLNHPAGRAIDLSAYTGISFDTRLIAASGRPWVAFNANGDFTTSSIVLPEPQPGPDAAWLTGTISFEDAAVSASGVSSIDFIIDDSDQPFEIWVRNLTLLCKGACP